MTASARHPTAQSRPGRRRRGCAMTAIGERSAMSRKLVAKRRSESNRVTATVGCTHPVQGGQLSAGSRDVPSEGGNGGWRGYRGGRDDQATAKLSQAIGHQRDNAGSRGQGRGGMLNRGENQRRRDQPRARRVQGVNGKGRGGGAWVGVAVPGAQPVADLAALRQKRRRRKRDQKLGEEEFKGRERLQVYGRKTRRGKRSEMRVVSSASGARHRDDGTERQLVHTRAHAIVFMVSRGRLIFAPFFSSRPGLPRLGRPKL